MSAPRKSLGISLRKRKRVPPTVVDPRSPSPKRRRPNVEEDEASVHPPTLPDRVQPHSSRLPGTSQPPPPLPKNTSRYIFEEDSDEESDSGVGTSLFLVPGHRYLGPGNPLDNGPPTNRVDEAAKRHDTSYSEAEKVYRFTGNSEQAFQDIQKADAVFLDDLSEIEPVSYTETFGKSIGQAGIKTKKGVEKLFHSTLYPSFSQMSAPMDVVDGPEPNAANFGNTPNNNMGSIINLGHGISKSHATEWSFTKNFNLAFESSCLQYNKSNANSNAPTGQTDLVSYIHSIPWEKICFYLTEREYNTVTNSFHTARVEYVKIKIFNLGVNNPIISQKSNVEYKVMNANNYFSIWRGFEKHGPCTLGSNITPDVLYGKSLVALDASATRKNVPKASVGAISEMKNVDNRVTYNKITSKWVDNKQENIPEAETFLPPLMEMSVLTLNANTATVLVYQTMYKPKDGLFHNKSYAFHNAAVVQHKPYDQNIDLADKGDITDATYVITDTAGHNTPIIKYENATIDNMFFKSLRGDASLQFIDGLGVGLLPKRDKSGGNVEAYLELSIQTEIKIRAEAFGGSVLSSGTSNNPQSNPNRIYFVHSKKKFGNAYASDGLPTMANV